MTARFLAAALTGAVLAVTGGVPAAAAPTVPSAWHAGALHLTEAHRLSTGAGITVAVLDSGAAPHRDLAGALLPQIDVAPAGTPRDPARGTELAGLIAARGDGRTGLLGVAPQAKILSVRVGARGFDAQPGAVAAGIDRAVAAGARVVVSTYTRPVVDGALATAVREAVASDVLVVAPTAPATATSLTLGDLPGVVSVTGTDLDGEPTRDVLTGLRIDVAAPGEDLVAPVRAGLGDAYAAVSGADFAAALTGGVAALVRSEFPDLPAADVARRLADGPERDLSLGRGELDARAALTRPLVALPAPRPAAGGGPARDRQWYLDALRIPDAHRLTLGDRTTLGLVAARIDTDRPDLAGRLREQVWITADGTPGDPPAGAARPADTAAAVLAGGSGRGPGYTGAAPAATLIAASGGPQQSAAQLEASVRRLVDHGAKVVLVIDGAPALTSTAAAYALGRDAVLIAPFSDGVPAVPGVITVRAAPAGSALSAPGEADLRLGAAHPASATPDESAAALVAGVAALARSQHPGEDARTTVRRLLSTATPVTGGPAADHLVDPVSAVTADITPVTVNPLGEPAPPGQPENDGGGGRWAVLGAAALGVLAVAALLTWLWRRRVRAAQIR